MFICIDHCTLLILIPTTFPHPDFFCQLFPFSFTYSSLGFHICHIYALDLYIFKSRLHIQEKNVTFCLSPPTTCFLPLPSPKSPFYSHVISTYEREHAMFTFLSLLYVDHQVDSQLSCLLPPPHTMKVFKFQYLYSLGERM